MGKKRQTVKVKKTTYLRVLIILAILGILEPIQSHS